MQIQFPRDENGRLDPTSTYHTPIEYKAIYKYASEARFCLGIANVTLNDGRVVGRRVRIFDYSHKKFIFFFKSLIE